MDLVDGPAFGSGDGAPGQGDLVLGLDPPDAVPTTRLDLDPRALFPGGPGRVALARLSLG